MGPMGAGKGTVAEYLKYKYGFVVFNLSQVVKEVTLEKGMGINRENMNATYDELKNKFGNDVVARRIIEKVKEEQKKVFNGSRDIAEAEYIKSKFANVLSIYIDADEEIRMKRIMTRQKDIDKGDIKALIKNDNLYALTSKNVEGIIIVKNNGTIQDLYSSIQTHF